LNQGFSVSGLRASGAKSRETAAIMGKEFTGSAEHRHGSDERCAVLLVNLGTPDSPDPRAIRRYLAEFLSDRRVIELPRLLWLPILYGVILPFRARRSAHAYRSIWESAGSPLRTRSEALAAGLQQSLAGAGLPVQVALAMRYGRPSVAATLDRLRAQGLRRVIVLPLYPQYSATTSASVFDAVGAALARWRWVPEMRTIADYCHEAAWLDAVAASVREHWRVQGRGERLMFSFHGIPKRYFRAGDPYFCQCQFSAREIALRLGLADGEWQVCFQSRVGREEWLRPYTDETLVALARGGMRRIDVICPGFAVDCLETLEEIAMQNAEAFVAAGGERLAYIPALNADAAHVDALAALVRRHGAGWPEFDPGYDAEHDRARRAAIAARRQAFPDE
jgi:ferrochelatase